MLTCKAPSALLGMLLKVSSGPVCAVTWSQCQAVLVQLLPGSPVHCAHAAWEHFCAACVFLQAGKQVSVPLLLLKPSSCSGSSVVDSWG